MNFTVARVSPSPNKPLILLVLSWLILPSLTLSSLNLSWGAIWLSFGCHLVAELSPGVGASPSSASSDASSVFTCVTRHSPDPDTQEVHRSIDKNALDLLLYAFEQAVCAGLPGNWNYINGVLARLAQRNITTLADAEAYDDDRYG